MGFSKQFLWGAATASFQIEGGWDADGKGLSVWDAFCRKEGAVFGKESGDVACDHYNRYSEDIGIMQTMGLQAYRFSFSWPRVLPHGTGEANAAGLDFYDKLIDGLLEANIEPMATLFHWDYPLELYYKGGWMNPDSPQWFAEYTALMAEKFSDRVKLWITHNEPACFGGMGHSRGAHAPGIKLGPIEYARVVMNILKAHGLSVDALREHSKQDLQIGMAPNFMFPYPETDSAEDVEKARSIMFEDMSSFGVMNTIWTDPTYLGSFPDALLETLGRDKYYDHEEVCKIACKKLDFLGVNIYTGSAIGSDYYQGMELNSYSPQYKSKSGTARNELGWPVTPEIMYWSIKYIAERYKLPLYITENGFCGPDWLAEDGHVHDGGRIDYTHKYLKQLKRAVDDGVDVRGYMHWSFIDNFEWAHGYSKRFGMVHVDYETQERTIKDSGLWYSKVIASNGENL